MLWPTVLLEAIEHSERVYITGTVREVMSAQQVIPTGEFGMTELPAPIETVPKRVLAIVAESRIERRGGDRIAIHDGREWTVEQLRSTINDRRRLLNMTDPLFLQIPNLEHVAWRSEADPGFLERFVGQLLGEMKRANERMMQRASDIDDGSYFALEASQYLRREGGRDWRGLRYTLQGIHALADEQIAPDVRADWRYAAGVNAAIDHKANFDELLMIGSTVGVIALGILCAPLGAVAAAAITGIAGIAFAAHDVLDAGRQADLYRALEDPEAFPALARRPARRADGGALRRLLGVRRLRHRQGRQGADLDGVGGDEGGGEAGGQGGRPPRRRRGA